MSSGIHPAKHSIKYQVETTAAWIGRSSPFTTFFRRQNPLIYKATPRKKGLPPAPLGKNYARPVRYRQGNFVFLVLPDLHRRMLAWTSLALLPPSPAASQACHSSCARVASPRAA